MSESAVALTLLGGESPTKTWDELMLQDVWAMSEVPHGDLSTAHRGGRHHLIWGGIHQPFLRDGAKLWARSILTNLSFHSVHRYIQSIIAFSDWLEANRPNASSAREITREVLLDYHLHVMTFKYARSTQSARIGDLNRLLNDSILAGHLPGLPATARFDRREIPQVPRSAPKIIIDEQVAAQASEEERLAKLRLHHRTIVEVMLDTALRISSCVCLGRDCIRHDGAGQPYLLYWNVKGKRERMVPISQRTEATVRASAGSGCAASSQQHIPLPRAPASEGQVRSPSPSDLLASAQRVARAGRPHRRKRHGAGPASARLPTSRRRLDDQSRRIDVRGATDSRSHLP